MASSLTALFLVVGIYIGEAGAGKILLPSFQKLKYNYPGYKHHGGRFRNNRIIGMIGCSSQHLLHDTSALRLSYAFNKVGGEHSLGKALIRLSKFGEDSVAGTDGLQYLYHPIAYGPYLADKYGYPSVSKLHQQDPISTKKNFWGKQGILRVITYTKHSNLPKGHVALWDCNHFHQSKDWIAGHSLITVEFWESPDTNCQGLTNTSGSISSTPSVPKPHHSKSKDNQNPHEAATSATKSHRKMESSKLVQSNTPKASSTQKVDLKKLLHNKSYRRKFLKEHFISNGRLRHAKHRRMVA